MKTKNLLKKAFLLLALMGGANSAWAADATWTLDYSSKAKSWTVTDLQETLEVSDYGTVTITYNNASIIGNAGYVKFGSNAYNITITLPQGKTFKAGDKLEITGKGGKSGAPGCVYAVLGEDIIKAADIATSSTDNFDSGELEIPAGFASSTLVIRRASSSEKQTDGTTACGGTFYVQKIIYTEISGPTINTQPISANYATGAVATPLSVSATASAGSLSYQWYSNTTATTEGAIELTGETSSTYTPSTASAGTTYYYCNVSDDNDNVNTDIVSVTVASGSAPSKPSIEGAPVSSVDNGASVTLTASSTGTPTPTYQWYSNTTSTTTVDNEHKISGATSSSYSPSTTTAGTIYYYVVASNSEGSATSDAVSVTVNVRTGCDLTQVIYSNSFDAFITQPTADPVANGTITAYYMNGDDAPTLSSVVISDGATYNVEGTTLTVTAEDGTTTKTYDITLSDVTPYTTEGSLSFDGSETSWVKGGPGFDPVKGWVFRKNADDGRISQGLTRLYFFVGPAKTVTLTNELISSTRGINVYVNGEHITGITSIAKSTASIDIPCSTAGNNMIAIVSNQTGGDGGFSKMKLTLTVKSLKVQYKLGDELIKEEILDTPAKNIGDSYTVPFHMYVEKDGALYKTTANGSDPYYGDNVTLTENHIVTKSLNTVDLGGGIIELFEDFDGSTENYGGVRGSNCSTYNSSAYTSTNNLPAGEYKFIVKAYNRGRGSSVKVGDTKIFDFTEVGGAWTDKTFEDVIIPTAGKLTFVAGGNKTYDPIDILIAIRTGEIATIGSMGYTTFSSSYPLNLDGIAGGTAYKVAESGVTAKVVTPEAVTGTIAAGEGLILSGIAGATVTIPVAASGDAISGNLMVGCPTGATLNSSTPNYETCYVLINGTTEAEFANLTNWISGGQEVNIPAGKAYLNTTASNSARSLRISFGNITNVANVEAAAEAKAQDGKFIENGKLVIIKNGVKYNAAGAKLY